MADNPFSFQKVQGLSALQSSIRYFSQIVMGTSVNVILVYFISRVKVVTLVVGSACITLVSPALMATAAMYENYWFRPFWALFLCPVNPWGKLLAPSTGALVQWLTVNHSSV